MHDVCSGDDSGAVTTAIPIVSPDDQRVTFVELFFDLVFVFCVTQVATLLHGHMDARSAGSALLVFWLVWWAWTQFAWALNAANTITRACSSRRCWRPPSRSSWRSAFPGRWAMAQSGSPCRM